MDGSSRPHGRRRGPTVNPREPTSPSRHGVRARQGVRARRARRSEPARPGASVGRAGLRGPYRPATTAARAARRRRQRAPDRFPDRGCRGPGWRTANAVQPVRAAGRDAESAPARPHPRQASSAPRRHEPGDPRIRCLGHVCAKSADIHPVPASAAVAVTVTKPVAVAVGFAHADTASLDARAQAQQAAPPVTGRPAAGDPVRRASAR